MNQQETLLQTIEWAQDPLRLCAGQPVITQSNFRDLADAVQGFEGVLLNSDQAYDMLMEQSKRFTACGANEAVNNRFGVIRKNPDTGWEYIITKLKSKEEQ